MDFRGTFCRKGYNKSFFSYLSAIKSKANNFWNNYLGMLSKQIGHFEAKTIKFGTKLNDFNIYRRDLCLGIFQLKMGPKCHELGALLE